MHHLVKKTIEKQVISGSYTRRDFLSTSVKVGAAAFTTGMLPRLNVRAEGKYNVLFMIVDDLRPMLGCYGIPEMHTPYIDSIAERGTLFNRAYCQYPLCNPSRASILTGLRPDTTRVNNNSADYKITVPNAVDIYQHFREQGYNTYNVGKVVHVPAPFTWGRSWAALDVSDDELSDGKTAKQIEELMVDIKDQQFFLTIGFDKPHLPLHAPQKYYDLYRPDTFSLPSTKNYPTNAPLQSYNKIDLLRLYNDIPSDDEPISEKKTLELIRAYAASTSYMDAQVGRVLRKLDELGLMENTVIVFCGDHGFHLGEHGTWRKNTLFEVGVRSPLLISIPRQQPCQTEALAELVDIYPTLCDACDLTTPEELEGLSLIPVIENPTQSWKTAAFSSLTRAGVVSVSMRTDRYRYTEWGVRGRFGRELYDYHTDPDETQNLVDLHENEALVEELHQRLYAGWEGALPGKQEQMSVSNTLPWDINNDGIVDMQDLLLVSNSFETRSLKYPKADVNKDGNVNIIDLLYVASHLGETCVPSAPIQSSPLSSKNKDNLSEWLYEAYQVDDGSDVFRQGILNLEAMLKKVVPDNTILLPNYPNPFNPETWIPYELAQDAIVNIAIYNYRGETVREIKIGFQIAGTYRTKEQAAFWDGRNSAGVMVASGIYFCSLTVGKSKSIRQMVVRK